MQVPAADAGTFEYMQEYGFRTARQAPGYGRPQGGAGSGNWCLIMEKKRFLEAGRIVNTHGVRGEVKIEPWADGPEFLKSFRTLYIDSRGVGVQQGRVHGDFFIAKLEGVDDMTSAMALNNKTLYKDRQDAKLPAGRIFIADIIGARVVSDDGQELGTLAEVMERPAHNIYVVKGKREILIPAVPEFVLSTDADEGVITVHLIEGM